MDSPNFFRQIVFIRVKTLCIANMVESRHTERDRASLQADMCRSETPVLKFLNTTTTAGNDDVLFIYKNVHGFRLWVIYPTHTSRVSSSLTLQASFGSFWRDRDQGTVRPASKRVYGKISRGCGLITSVYYVYLSPSKVILLRIHS